MDKYERRRLRLLELKDTRCNGKAVEVARAIGREPSYVSRMLYPEGKAGKKRIADDMMEVIENAFSLPRGWLDSEPDFVIANPDGTATLVQVKEVPPQIPQGASIRAYETVDELDPESYVLVDRYDVQLSAGCGNIQWVVNEKDPLSFRARWFQVKRLNPDNCKALYVRGRSMEPKLEDWDTVLIDTAQTEIIDGEIYAVCLQDEFFIKTVERIAGGVKLKSENPDFESIEVRGEELGALRIIGKKVWRGG